MRKSFAVFACALIGCSQAETPSAGIEIAASTPADATVPVVHEPASSPVTMSTAMVAQTVKLADGRTFVVKIREGLHIQPALEGLKRLRFFAKAPDGRIFATDMNSLADNRKGIVYLLEGWDEIQGTFTRATPFASGLRNPNQVAFYRDKSGRDWMYIAETHQLTRFPYAPGDRKPQPAQVIATYPDYGLSYKYGGWHLTRSLTFADDRMYVSVGSSCNACEEKEDVRATIIRYNPDGSDPQTVVTGVRNSVDLVTLPDQRVVFTNQATDKLGDHIPDETMWFLKDGMHLGWPQCYYDRGVAKKDPNFAKSPLACKGVPERPFAFFPAHSSALGVEYFGKDSRILNDQFVVALHGAMNPKDSGGNKLVAIPLGGGTPVDLLTGFWDGRKKHGRPCGVLALGPDRFLVSDDANGIVYYIRPKVKP